MSLYQRRECIRVWKSSGRLIDGEFKRGPGGHEILWMGSGLPLAVAWEAAGTWVVCLVVFDL